MTDAALSIALSLLMATCAATVVIAGLRPLMLRICGAVAVLRLWWILPLALLATAIPKYAAPVEEPAEGYIEFATLASPAPVVALPAAAAAPARIWPWKEIGFAVWLGGALLTAAWMARAQIRFSRSVRWQTRHRGTLPANSGPAVVGAFAPRLALPADFASRYSAAERRLILLHEFIHLYRRDGLANLAMSVLLVLQWFNPLLHWASRAMSRDQEGACDAAVAVRHPNALRTYAHALLKTQPDMQHLPLVCRWQAYHPTVERIAMLKMHRNAGVHSKRAAVLLIAGAALASALAYAAKPAEPPAVPTVPVAPSVPAVEAPPPVAPVTPKVEAQLASPPVTVSSTESRSQKALAPMPQPGVPTTPVLPTVAPVTPSQLQTTAPTAPTITTPTPPTAPTPPAPAVVPPAPFAYAPGVTPVPEESERITLNFKKVKLGAFIQVVADFTGIKFEGVELLQEVASPTRIVKRNVLAIATTRLVLACHGFSLRKAARTYLIEKAPSLPAQTDPDNCIAEGMVDGPEQIGWNKQALDRASYDQSRITVRMKDTDLQTFVGILIDEKDFKIVGVEKLRGVKFSVAKQNAVAMELISVALQCQGYSLIKDGGRYVIEESNQLAQANPTACVEAGVANGSERAKFASPGPAKALSHEPAYKIDLAISRDGQVLAQPNLIVWGGKHAAVAVRSGGGDDRNYLLLDMLTSATADSVSFEVDITAGPDRTPVAKPRLVTALGKKASLEFRQEDGATIRLEVLITEGLLQTGEAYKISAASMASLPGRTGKAGPTILVGLAPQ